MIYSWDEEFPFFDIYHEKESEMTEGCWNPIYEDVDDDPEPGCWLCDQSEDVCECTKAELQAAWEARPVLTADDFSDPFSDGQRETER